MIIRPLKVEMKYKIAESVRFGFCFSVALWSAFVSNLTSDNVEMVSTTLRSIKTKLIRCFNVRD